MMTKRTREAAIIGEFTQLNFIFNSNILSASKTIRFLAVNVLGFVKIFLFNNRDIVGASMINDYEI